MIKVINDRPPRHAVEIDEYNDAEEMEVDTSFREAVMVALANNPGVDLSKVGDVEPWLRVRCDTYVCCDVTLIPEEDDCA